MRTRVWLCMESSVFRIFIFIQTCFAHHETFHRCIGSVVGNVVNDGISWPAVCAVEEWVLISTIFRVKELTKTVFTNRNVRGNKGGYSGVIDTFCNVKSDIML